MNTYLVLYNSPVSAADLMEHSTPEEMKAGMDAWTEWGAKAGSALVDFGLPLGESRRVEGGSTSPGTSFPSISSQRGGSLMMRPIRPSQSMRHPATAAAARKSGHALTLKLQLERRGLFRLLSGRGTAACINYILESHPGTA